MVRIAYFGTDGHPGHHVIPIRGKFTTGQKVASNWNPTEHDIMSNDWEMAE